MLFCGRCIRRASYLVRKKDMEPDHFVYLCALSKVFAYKCAVGRQLMETFGGPEGVFRTARRDLVEVNEVSDDTLKKKELGIRS